jgi:hypothetical protein
VAALAVIGCGCQGTSTSLKSASSPSGPHSDDSAGSLLSPATPPDPNDGRIRIGGALWVIFTDIPVFADLLDPIVVKDDGTVTLLAGLVVKANGKTSEELEKVIHDYYVPKLFKQMTVNVRVSTPPSHQ